MFHDTFLFDSYLKHLNEAAPCLSIDILSLFCYLISVDRINIIKSICLC